MSYFTDYIKAFGDVQAEWIDLQLRHELKPWTVWLLDHLPTDLAKRLALRTGLAITRSFIPGGHAIHITRHRDTIGSAKFKLNDRGWYLVDELEEPENEEA